MSGLFDWMVVFNWVVLVILLMLLVLIRIALNVFRLVFLLRQGLKYFGDSVQRLDHRFEMCHLCLFCQ